MITFERVIFPVGQGGFAYENIGGYSIVFDCGSKSPKSESKVPKYINDLRAKQNDKIDRLYISHFDKDHVDGITELIDIVGVKRAVIPYVPVAFRVAYNAITDGAYSSIREIITGREIGLDELSDERNDNTDVWEWISKPMLTMEDWEVLGHIFDREGIDSNMLHDPMYIDQNKKTSMIVSR
jgi:glyoxylase-like metal-dependent hydrolase (beta-lactamase superfamily II)